MITQGTGVRSSSRISSTMTSINSDQDLETDELDDITGVYLERRRSSRVSFKKKKRKN